MKKVLILGAGMVAGPPVKYLLENGFQVIVASRTKSKAIKHIGDHPNGIAKEFDITKASKEELDELVKECDLAVSLLPYIYHVQVAKSCIKFKKHMVTTSYVSPEMKALDQEAKDAGITILNEIGVDPGIDHMSAKKIIDDVHEKGGKILSFKSYCGGLPAPDAVTTPWKYKLSWSPRGVILAGRNPAKYQEDGKIVDILGEDLFDNYYPYPVEGLEDDYEAYPNRDSTPYIDIYEIPETKTMFRGTLRNTGWCRALKKVADSGYMDIEELELPAGFTYAQLTNKLLGKPLDADSKQEFMKKFNLVAEDDIIHRFEWMGLFGNEEVPSTKISPLDALCYLWEKNLQYSPSERDMLIMVHEFEYELPEGKERHISTMVDLGIKDGPTSMSRTVGLPCAIGVRMILEGKITDKGVLIPVQKHIYEPVLKELEELNIGFTERIEKI
ncbi:MAG: saccharopine dehydrogenase NADP-binding domain-containing protein [Candidatus Heimdallarchaeota archaeon]|nr:MAG: saccharopine dehydrogenase NADP-binding domain-containing protein [Candidatus Heimdallarchaeota archaeon]